MDIRVLRYFLTIVREGSFSRAAETLFITQPTLSRQIAQLEDELGTKLFLRDKQLTLTDSGLMLRRRAEEMLELMDIIKSEFQSGDELSGKISIGCGGLRSVNVLMEEMARFKQLYPKVTFELYTNSAEDIKEKLDRGLLDFAILLEPIEIQKYHYLRIETKERWGLFMPSSSPLAAQAEITKRDLINLPLIMSNRQALQKEIAHWLRLDWDELKIVATYNIITNVAEMVSNNLGYAMTIEGAVEQFDPARFTFTPFTPPLEMTSVIAWKKRASSFNAADTFLAHLKSSNFVEKTQNQ